MEITKQELFMYQYARVKSKALMEGQSEESKFSMNSWEISGLPIAKYLYIAEFMDI